ncbi:tetraspanin-18-like [Liolophura sinensis]|uniref:tetraspanin-18-like n=1 Tax=Liolophura sinensis TaxID=3198878 RepID=UPI0031596411
MVILGAELAALILGILYKEEWIIRLRNSLESQISTRFDGKLDSPDIVTAAINKIHQEFDCCGVHNYSDFDMATKWNRTTAMGDEMQIPPSCCSNYKANKTCVTMPTPQNSYIDTGCWSSIESLMEQYTLIMIIIAAITFILEVFLIVFSMCLVGKIRSGYSLEK